MKKPSKRARSAQSFRNLENEYQMTRVLNTADGARKALEQKTIDNQPALILEYIEGQTLRETITELPGRPLTNTQKNGFLSTLIAGFRANLETIGGFMLEGRPFGMKPAKPRACPALPPRQRNRQGDPLYPTLAVAVNAFETGSTDVARSQGHALNVH